MKIACYGCKGKKVKVRLTNGKEIYPNREDLRNLLIWKCDTCGNYVGCHPKDSNGIVPLGCIATKKIKAKRIGIHRIMDPLWQSGSHKRNYVYRWLSNKLGYTYHTGNVKNMEEVDQVKKLLKEFVIEHPVGVLREGN